MTQSPLVLLKDTRAGERIKIALLYIVFYWPGAALADFGERWHRLGNRWS